MDKFTTKEITVEILEDITAHSVYIADVNGKEGIVGYNLMEFLKRHAKEETK